MLKASFFNAPAINERVTSYYFYALGFLQSSLQKKDDCNIFPDLEFALPCPTIYLKNALLFIFTHTSG